MTVTARITPAPQVVGVDTIAIEIVKQGTAVTGYSELDFSVFTTAEKNIINSFIALVTAKSQPNV